MIGSIGTFLLGCVLLLYWGRVVRMAYRQRKRTGRAANFIPRERLGRILRVIWNPVVGIWVLHPLVSAFLDEPSGMIRPAYDNRIVALPGALLAAGCYVFTIVAWKKMGSGWRMGIDPNEKNDLIVTGPFAYVRHPIYALSILLMLTSVIVVPTPLMMIVASIHILLIIWEALREERHMHRQHGQAYTDYRNRVGAFFPLSQKAYQTTEQARRSDPFGRGCEVIPLNIFQRMARWFDQVHPYNAVHVLKLSHTYSLCQVETAWNEAIAAVHLGRVYVRKNKYGFEPLSPGEKAPVQWFNGTTQVRDVIETEINRPFVNGDMPMRAFIVATAQGQFLGLTYAHWIADAAAIRIVLGEWISRLANSPVGRNGATQFPHEGYLNLFSPRRANWDLLGGVLYLLRGFCRLRQAKKIDGRGLDNPAVGVELFPVPHGLITQLRQSSRDLHCTVNDIFMAALLETSAKLIPLQKRRNRNDVAVGNIIDLRRFSSTDLHETFGMFLGLTSVVARPADLRQWPRLLHCVIRQNNMLRGNRMAPASILRLGLAAAVSTMSSDAEMYHFFRKEAPLAGGISNVNLNNTWVESACREGSLREYFRVSPTGPLVPVTLSLTTLADTLQLAITYRKSLMDCGEVKKLAECFVRRLEMVANFDDHAKLETKLFTGDNDAQAIRLGSRHADRPVQEIHSHV